MKKRRGIVRLLVKASLTRPKRPARPHSLKDAPLSRQNALQRADVFRNSTPRFFEQTRLCKPLCENASGVGAVLTVDCHQFASEPAKPINGPLNEKGKP